MRKDARITAPLVAALVVTLAVAALAAPLAAAERGRSITAPAATAAKVPACKARNLAASYTLVPFSQGLGHVSYTLIIENGARRTCKLYAPRSFRLLGRNGQPLPTHGTTSPGGRYAVTLRPLQWAQTDSSFSPDIPGRGEGSPCEGTAVELRIGIGGGQVLAVMDPTPVCEHGAIGFSRLAAVPLHPSCGPRDLKATFKRVGATAYGLALENIAAHACWLDGAPYLQLLGRRGRPLPTRQQFSVPFLIIVARHGTASSLATFSTRPGPGEPRHGACEPKAAKVEIGPIVGFLGRIKAAVTPPVSVCHRGRMTMSGLVPGFPFS